MAFMYKTLRSFSAARRKFHTGHTIRKRTPNPWDLATGIERWEGLQISKGNLDPFLMFPQKRGKGTKDCPMVIQSVYNKRVIACICNSDCNHIIYWWLHEGYPRRCECNFWFVLDKIEMPKIYEDSA